MFMPSTGLSGKLYILKWKSPKFPFIYKLFVVTTFPVNSGILCLKGNNTRMPSDRIKKTPQSDVLSHD